MVRERTILRVLSAVKATLSGVTVFCARKTDEMSGREILQESCQVLMKAVVR